MPTVNYRQTKLYKILKTLYIITYIISPIIIWLGIGLWTQSFLRQNTPMMDDTTYTPFYTVSGLIFLVFYILTLEFLKRLIISIIFRKNKKRLIIFTVLILAVMFGWYASARYLKSVLINEITNNPEPNALNNITPTSLDPNDPYGLKYAPLTGKPVIYLYTTETTDIRVQVQPIGGLTISNPEYPSNGWFVRADQNSNIFNYADNTNYPYLFWEGFAYTHKLRPDKGYLLAKNDVHTQMTKLLEQYGLNEKEISGFLEFWEPKLTTNNFVAIYFVPQSQMDAIAPLGITPAPQTIIRVFIDYIALDQPIPLEEPAVTPTPTRNGFTVVEWGGALDI